MMVDKFGKFIRGNVFKIIFYIASLGVICYLADRVNILIESISYLDLKIPLIIGFTVFLAYMLFYFNSSKAVKKSRTLYEVCSVVLCIFLNSIICMFVFDVIFFFTSMTGGIWYVLPVFVSLLISIYGFIHAKTLKVKRYHVKLREKVHKKVILLSDIHIGTFVNKKQLQKIIRTVNGLDCDMVIIAGDTFDEGAFEHSNLTEVSEELKKLSSKQPVYATLGNHDPTSASPEVRKFFKDSNIHLLIDEITETENFILIGRDDVMRNPKRKSLNEIFQNIVSDKPKIVIDHNPVGIKEADRELADIVLCGHTHRGQFFPANIFTKITYGKQGFYGYFKGTHTQSIVSAGVGYFQMPMRTGTDSEIVVIDLESIF